MATEEQIARVLCQMDRFHPSEPLKHMNAVHAGIGATLRLLNKSEEGTVTAGKISELLHVSTARVAALLRSMEEKELITKTASPEDGRVTVVLLSENGRRVAGAMHARVRGYAEKLIDRLGMEKLETFFAIGEEIRATLGEPPDAP